MVRVGGHFARYDAIGGLTTFRSAALSSGVQAGFVIGALFVAVLGIPDRFDPRFVFAASTVCAGFVNASLILSSQTRIWRSLPALRQVSFSLAYIRSE